MINKDALAVDAGGSVLVGMTGGEIHELRMLPTTAVRSTGHRNHRVLVSAARTLKRRRR